MRAPPQLRQDLASQGQEPALQGCLVRGSFLLPGPQCEPGSSPRCVWRLHPRATGAVLDPRLCLRTGSKDWWGGRPRLAPKGTVGSEVSTRSVLPVGSSQLTHSSQGARALCAGSCLQPGRNPAFSSESLLAGELPCGQVMSSYVLAAHTSALPSAESVLPEALPHLLDVPCLCRN